jgi:glutamate-ammonia-ligase adenylyltransferase
MGNIGLLLLAEQVGLLPHSIGERAAWAYRELRHRQHQARLDEQAGRDEPANMAAHKAAILALWQAVFDRYTTQRPST